MADSTSAEIFGETYIMLASSGLPEDQLRKMVVFFWTLGMRYDFSPQQMGCDDALVQLGLLRKVPDPGNPHGSLEWVYGLEVK